MQSKDSLGETFHLTAGQGSEVTHGALTKDIHEIMRLKSHLRIPFWVYDIICRTPLKNIFSKEYWAISELAVDHDGYFRGKVLLSIQKKQK